MSLRFVICSDPRCGGHMLASALHRHSQLRMAGEIFVRPELFGLPARPARNRDEGYAARLIAAAWKSYQGFIIHRRFHRGLQVLGEDHTVRAVFLTRENWLAQYASEQLAQQTGVWHIASSDAHYLSDDGRAERVAQLPVLLLAPSACRRFRDDTRRREAAALRLFRDNRVWRVTYEQMTSDWDAALAGVLEFLRLPQEPLTPATERQEQRPLQECIGNYAELQRQFL